MDLLRIPDAEQLEPGAIMVVPHPDGAPPWRSVLVVHVPEVGLRAYWNVCQHLPVPLDSGIGALPPERDLVCLTHGARYRPEDGRCTAGPCKGRALVAVRLSRDEAGWLADVSPPE